MPSQFLFPDVTPLSHRLEVSPDYRPLPSPRPALPLQITAPGHLASVSPTSDVGSRAPKQPPSTSPLLADLFIRSFRFRLALPSPTTILLTSPPSTSLCSSRRLLQRGTRHRRRDLTGCHHDILLWVTKQRRGDGRLWAKESPHAEGARRWGRGMREDVLVGRIRFEALEVGGR